MSEIYSGLNKGLNKGLSPIREINNTYILRIGLLIPQNLSIRFSIERFTDLNSLYSKRPVILLSGPFLPNMGPEDCPITVSTQ